MISSLDNYEVQQKIGTGGTGIVKAVKRPGDGTVQAAKIIRTESDETREQFAKLISNEYAALRQISHPGVVGVHHFSTTGTYTKKGTCAMYQCMYIVMDLCPNGDLYHLITQSEGFSVEVVRFFFLRVAEALEAVHTAGYSHRDIKPENILLDSDWSPRLSDFGLSALSQGRGNFQLQTRVGTDNYMAPEVYHNQSYDGPLADVYSLGKILFLLYSRSPPFNFPILSDRFFKNFQQDQEWFWKAHSTRKPTGFFSNEFKELICGMLKSDPRDRWSLTEVLQHPWCKGPVATLETIANAFENLKNRRIEVARVAAEKASSNMKKSTEEHKGVFKGDELSGSDSLSLSWNFSENLRKKPAPEFLVNKAWSFPTGVPVKQVIDLITKIIDKYGSDSPLQFHEAKIIISVVTETGGLKLKIDFYDLEGLTLLDFTLEEGSKIEFMEVFREITSTMERISLS